MPFITTSLLLLWFIRTIKFVLFWIYLWQLKNYHIGRFVDHFRTHQGRKLLANWQLAVKVILLGLFVLHSGFIWLLALVYLAESLLFAFQWVKGSIRKPVFTLKVILITMVAGIAVVVFGLLTYQMQWPPVWLLVFDIVTPIIVSVLILIIHAFFVLARNGILKKATQTLAQHKGITVIGITGSYGKTSTKEFLTTILSKKFSVLSTPEHKNSEMGIAQTILNDLKPHHQIFVVEMGSYAKGGIKLLCDMVRPKIGVVTGVNEQHLATFGSMDNLLSAEGGIELVKSLPKNGTIVVNGDNVYCLDLYKKVYSLVGVGLKKRIYTVGRQKIASDIWTEDVVVHKNHLSFIVQTQDKHMAHIRVNVVGKQNVQNILAAILVAREFGMSLGEIAEACKNIQNHQAGVLLKQGKFGLEIIDSSYSANPDGVTADLDYLATFAAKKIIVMPCLIELGNKSTEVHQRIGQKIAAVCDLAIITTQDKFKELKSAAVQAGMAQERIILAENSIDIFNHITTFCKEGDAVLLEGRVPDALIKLLTDEK